MMWQKWRKWLALAGPLIAVVVVAATPAGVKEGAVPWPKWLIAALLAAAGVLAGVWTPLVKAVGEALAAPTRRNAQRRAQAEVARRRLPASKGKPPLVQEVDPALLGIHEAISLPAGTAVKHDLSPDLPRYVTRDIDSDLRKALQTATGKGGFILLVGPAAAGKTRCAYEAIRAELPGWELLLPGNDASALNQLVEGEAELRKCVVWLDEIQKFLIGTERLTAATVLRLRADTANPVLLIGTIWPDIYDRLRSPASEGQKETSEGFDSNSRDVLKLARPYRLSGTSPAEWARAEELSSADPRIAQAAQHRHHGGLTQVLAAAPELIHRWEQADDPFCKAVISAAVAARRCNHPETIPFETLQALTEEYLTGPDRAAAASTWFVDALECACEPVVNSGGIAPLSPYGEAVGVRDGYRVSDVLVHHATATRGQGSHNIPTSVWARLIAEATPQACIDIGFGAFYEGDHAQARCAWERAIGAAETPDTEAGIATVMSNLGVLLMAEGEMEGARKWMTRAAETGIVSAMNNLSALAAKQGNTDEARKWMTRAAETGDTNAMNELGVHSAENGDFDEARKWFTRAAETGDTNAMSKLGVVLLKKGDIESACKWFTCAAETDDGSAMKDLSTLAVKQGNTDEARKWMTRAAETDDTNAMNELGVHSAENGDFNEARKWFTRAAETDDTSAMKNLST
uniref:tetratricopeptide repeat protein n=1 Tax=Streptomyces winkii TaxID=3051178 RepID=UPI0028D390CC